MASCGQAVIVRFHTLPKTLNVSPVNISGTISHLISLAGSNGLIGPHGGTLKSPPFCIAINQCVPFEDMKERRFAASPVSPCGVPSQSIGYCFPRLTSLYSSPAFAKDGAWNKALQAPNDAPVN